MVKGVSKCVSLLETYLSTALFGILRPTLVRDTSNNSTDGTESSWRFRWPLGGHAWANDQVSY